MRKWPLRFTKTVLCISSYPEASRVPCSLVIMSKRRVNDHPKRSNSRDRLPLIYTGGGGVTSPSTKEDPTKSRKTGNCPSSILSGHSTRTNYSNYGYSPKLGMPSGKTPVAPQPYEEETRRERYSDTHSRSSSHNRSPGKMNVVQKRSNSVEYAASQELVWSGSGWDLIAHRQNKDIPNINSTYKKNDQGGRDSKGLSPASSRRKVEHAISTRFQANKNMNTKTPTPPSPSGSGSPRFSPHTLSPNDSCATPPISPTSPLSIVSKSGIPGGGCTQSKTKDMGATHSELQMNPSFPQHSGGNRDAKNGPMTSLNTPPSHPATGHVHWTLNTSPPSSTGPSANTFTSNTKTVYTVRPDPGKSGVGVSKSTSHTSSVGTSGYPQNTAHSSSSHTGHRGATASFTTSHSHTEVYRGVKGLRNLGNTCFMNCILQCLSHTPKLVDIFKGSKLSYCQESVMKGQLAKAYGNLLKEMWDEGSVSVSPTGFKSQIQKYARRFMGYEQQDCQEFLRFLLSGLHEDLNTPVSFKDKGKAPKSDEELAEYSWRKYLSFESSPISDLFMGQLKSTLVCEKCKQKSVTFDPFWDLSLPMKRQGIGVDAAKVTDCLKEFTTKEKLTGPESAYCDKCDSLEEAEKTLEIQKLPTILVLHLKRFAGLRFRSKLDVPIDIPLQLEMGPYLVNKSGATLFSLYGVTNHSGTAYGGHYTALCKHVHSGQWYSFNDSQVNPHGAPSRPSTQAYVLFYSRKDQN